jgi:hypothetical protein
MEKIPDLLEIKIMMKNKKSRNQMKFLLPLLIIKNFKLIKLKISIFVNH